MGGSEKGANGGVPRSRSVSNASSSSAGSKVLSVVGGVASSVDGSTAGSNMERGAWGGKIEFILTCIGYAVGLGNVWRFPYLTYQNGGGAFLIPFVIMLFIIGIPLFFMELCFGQFASLGPITIWNINPMLKGLGFSMVITNLFIAMYYNVIICWCIYFLFASMTDQLPWETCDNLWNTPYCMETKNYANISDNHTLSTNETVHRSELKSPSDEYYYRKVLQISNGLDEAGTIVWELALCLFLCWAIVFLVLIKGIGSLGKVVYFTSTFPYVLLTIMLIRGVTLEGAWTGIQYYLIPDWSKLLEAKVWSDAATQIFYALSTCTGGMLALASYNQFNNNTLRDSLIVPIVNVLTSFYAGFVIFSVLGYMAEMKGVSVDEVADGGPGLVFVVYPEGLVTMPVAPLWSILFFFMMLLLGYSSMFSMAECFFSGFMDEYPSVLRKSWYRTVIFRGIGCLCFYLISLPMVTNAGYYLFTIYDAYTGNFPLLIIGIIEMTSISYVYGIKNFEDDIKMMLGKKPVWLMMIFRGLWMVISPGVLLAVVIFTAITYKPPVGYDGYEYPAWGEGIGWLVVGICLVFIPVMFIWGYCWAGGAKLCVAANKPTERWGPAHAKNRTGRYAKDYKQQLVDNEERRSSDAQSRSRRSSSTPSGYSFKQPPLVMTIVEEGGAVTHVGIANQGFDATETGSCRKRTAGHGDVADVKAQKGGHDDGMELVMRPDNLKSSHSDTSSDSHSDLDVVIF